MQSDEDCTSFPPKIGFIKIKLRAACQKGRAYLHCSPNPPVWERALLKGKTYLPHCANVWSRTAIVGDSGRTYLRPSPSGNGLSDRNRMKLHTWRSVAVRNRTGAAGPSHGGPTNWRGGGHLNAPYSCTGKSSKQSWPSASNDDTQLMPQGIVPLVQCTSVSLMLLW